MQAFHGEKELFASDHVDFVHKNTVLGKCRVMTLKKYQELPTVGEHDYFARFTYKVCRQAVLLRQHANKQGLETVLGSAMYAD